MKKFLLCLTSIMVFIFFNANGQNDSIYNPYEVNDTLHDDFLLFNSDKILELSLRFDITQFKKKKFTEEYQKAILTYHLSDKDSINKEIKLKSRGLTRREICSFPPIKLNFNNSDSDNKDLKKFNNVKMVTHCNAGREDYLLKEYLIYKLYNILTDYSFKVRLLKIKYIDTHKSGKPINTFAFLIEPLKFLCERTNSVEIESRNLSLNNIVPEMMDRMAIFNYMVGNTDWSVPNQHNCEILFQPKSERPDLGLIIPYDFDYSGLINADYAIPHESLPIEKVTERIYLGKCRDEKVYLKELKEFQDKKEDFYQLINEFEYLDSKKKKVMINYLDGFFNQFDKNNSIIYSLREHCVK
jgi:hypothetical protein